MALITAGFGIAFETQTASGSLAPQLASILSTKPTTITDEDGAVFGNAETGIGNSGIDFQLARNARGPAFVSGSFTRKFDEFVSAELASFSFSWPAAGNKETLSGTPADAEFQYVQGGSGQVAVGIEAILASGSIISDGALAAGTGWRYKMGPAQQVSAVIWEKQDDAGTPKGTAHALIDCLCDLSLDQTPGSPGIWTATFTGKPSLADKVAYDFPTFTYGGQDQVAAPNVELATNLFGAPRGWSSNTITIGNGIESTPDSNALNGARIEQSTREVSISMTLDADDAVPDFDYDNLVATVAQTDNQNFQIGLTGQADNPATAYRVQAANLNIQDWQPEVPARALARTINAFATSDTAGEEFFFDLV